MDPKEIKELIKIVEESNIDELEVGRWWKKVRIRKNGGFGFQQLSPVQTIAVPGESTTGDREKPESPVGSKPEKVSSYYEVKSPMVGTFYRAPSPDSEPYVREGDRVRSSQVLCIIEAMKLMNEIESEVDGTIVKILIENAQPVEYNQPLFLIER